MPQHPSRAPLWSERLTIPMTRVVRVEWRPAALNLIKGLHTAAFVSVGGAILLFTWDGLRGRSRLRTAVACGVALAETAIYASNNQVCPLTPLAEELGAERGSVADIFLPDWFSRRIPLLGSAAMVLGLALNLRAWLGRSQPARPAGSVPCRLANW